MAGVKAGPVVEADVDPVTADVEIGGCVCAADPVAFNDHRPVTRLTVRNRGDRPVQIGSHFHVFEVDRAPEFDRPAAFGQHLNVPTSTALRFEPGDEREVDLEQGAAFGACGLPNDAGLVFKVLARETAKMKAKVREFWGIVREELTGTALTAPFFWR